MNLYRQYFTAEEIAMLDATPHDDLTSEINLLRVLLSRALAAATKHVRDLTLKQHAAILSTFSAAGIVIASLVRLQDKLHPATSGILAEIAAGEEIARQRLHVYSYFSSSSPA